MNHAKILVLNGPNLNVLGIREPEIYGSATFGDVVDLCHKMGASLGCEVDCRQSNHEGQLVDWIQESRNAFDAIVINGGAYTHTSVAILDALKFTQLPVIEIHLSNIFQREEFRHHSYISLAATGVICGLGIEGYAHAIRAAHECIEKRKK